MSAARNVKRALARIRAALPLQRTTLPKRNIRLGLERIRHIIPKDQRWIGIHIGGTNGKGSICSFLDGMLKLAGISHGTFTSPAIPERFHGLTINGLYVNERMYDIETQHVQNVFRRVAAGWRFSLGEDHGELTPFELETAAAFRLFQKLNVRYGIVEVGMGGNTDATNAMQSKAITIISKIALDHQEYLGKSIEKIAKVKAGIMRAGVPCIVDFTNSPNVLDILKDHARKTGTQVILSSKAMASLSTIDETKYPLEGYEQQNLLCAISAYRHLFPNLELNINRLLVRKPCLPGRKERIKISKLTGSQRQQPLLVDGAHNMLGIEALTKYLESKVRQKMEPITWIMSLSASETKPFAHIVETALQPQDNLAFIEYSRRPNDPAAVPAVLGRDLAREILDTKLQLFDGEPSLQPAIRWACEKSSGGPIVVTGSLYLVRELYDLEGVEPERKVRIRRPGSSQLKFFNKLAEKRNLSDDEARDFKQARRHCHLSPLRNPVFRVKRDHSVSQPLTISIGTRKL